MNARPKKFIFVTGGVLSGLGKGLSSAAIGALLEARGLRVTFLKLDPYLNVDPGTMNPIQHGEVYVTEDGAETDLDLGHYERFTKVRTSRVNNVTAGRVYESVIAKERRGEYLGGTVQVIPHVTDEIKQRIHKAAEDGDILICEARWATSSRCPFSRRCASSARTSGARTSATCTSRWCRSSPRWASSRPSRSSTP